MNIDHIKKTFEPHEQDARLYDLWQKADAFRVPDTTTKRPFTLMMPPPNITGQLHIGHALDDTIQDAIVRYHRLKGEEALYMPGSDHAAIATEVRVTAHLKAQGIAKADLTREAFLEHVWAWKETYGNRIVEQQKRLGLSADWSRLAFTMDETRARATTEAFVRLYEAGLMYRGERIIHWCKSCHTTICDAEVVYETRHDHLYYVRYPFADGDGDLVIATSRPETMFADVAVAIHPNDPEAKARVGRRLALPLTTRTIPVIADDYVDPEFGTGALKITPGHDPNDFEVGARHGLEILTVIDEDGRLTEACGRFAGLTVEEARRAVVEALKAEGALCRVEPLEHNVGCCYRCGTTIEPRVSLQWFVAIEPLAKKAMDAVRSGDVRFIPPHFEKTFFNFMEHIRDWNVSRQLWWGHRIPAYICEACGHITVSRERPSVCESCGHTSLHQDEDTLDTWFSSALWPYATLGWPESSEAFKTYFPTDVIVMGYDIIFFWGARMIMSSLHNCGDVPFKDIVIHGLVRDEQGRKMSKSLDNGIDPLEIIDRYGADALRYALIANTSMGMDQNFSVQRVEAGRNFINKLWNAYRYVLMRRSDGPLNRPDPGELCPEDTWILTELSGLIERVSAHLDRYDLNLALDAIYSFVWECFCDWYIEMSKVRFLHDDPSAGVAEWVMNRVLVDVVTLLHPIMPFFTEAIYEGLEHEPGLLIRASWPMVDKAFVCEDVHDEMERLMAVIRAIRAIRAEHHVDAKSEVSVILVCPDHTVLKALMCHERVIARLAGVGALSPRTNARDVPKEVVATTFDGGTLYVPLRSLIDPRVELGRVDKELAALEIEMAKLRAKLNTEAFVTKAPPALVAGERERLAKRETTQKRLLARQNELRAML